MWRAPKTNWERMRDGMMDGGISRRLVLLCIVIAGCAPTVPKSRVVSALPRGADPAIYVTAGRQKEEIVRALQLAGFRVVDVPHESSYLLRVTIGVDQGTRSCGTLNNVRYSLRTGGREIAEVAAKGWTGSCEPNVLAAASQELRRRVVEMTGEDRQ